MFRESGPLDPFTGLLSDRVLGMPKAVRPFGSWPSPISADVVTREGLRLSEVCFDGDEILWLERRPREAGRSVVVARGADGECRECWPLL